MRKLFSLAALLTFGLMSIDVHLVSTQEPTPTPDITETSTICVTEKALDDPEDAPTTTMMTTTPTTMTTTTPKPSEPFTVSTPFGEFTADNLTSIDVVITTVTTTTAPPSVTPASKLDTTSPPQEETVLRPREALTNPQSANLVQMDFELPTKNLVEGGEHAGEFFLEHLSASPVESIQNLSLLLTNLIRDYENSRQRRVARANNQTLQTKDVQKVWFLSPILTEPVKPFVVLYAENSDESVVPNTAVISALDEKKSDIEKETLLSSVSFRPHRLPPPCDLFCRHFVLFVVLMVVGAVLLLLLLLCCCCMHARDRRREHYSPADEERGIVKDKPTKHKKKPQNGAFPYESPLSDEEIKKDEMMELTPESSTPSEREPSPQADSESLVDDPHEGWVIPYDQGVDRRGLPTSGHAHRKSDLAPLQQNMEDTRL